MTLIVERLSARPTAGARRAAAAAAWPLLLTLSLAACGGGLGPEADVPSAAPAAPGTALSSAPSAAPVSPLTPHQE
jgi:hypothetical protein